MLLSPRSIAVGHRVILYIPQFPGGSLRPVRVIRETEACSLTPDDSVLGGNGRYTPLRHDATNARRKISTATGIPFSPSVPSALQMHSGSDSQWRRYGNLGGAWLWARRASGHGCGLFVGCAKEWDRTEADANLRYDYPGSNEAERVVAIAGMHACSDGEYWHL